MTVVTYNTLRDTFSTEVRERVHKVKVCDVNELL